MTVVKSIVIEPGRIERDYWQDVWRHRELLYFLAWRDVIVRYKQTSLGLAWSVIRPSATMIAFTLVFGRLANLPSGDVPYPVLVFAGLLPWQLFSTAFSDMSGSVVSNAGVVSKIYFPRLIIPISVTAVSVVDFIIALGVLAGLMWWFGYWPDWRVLTLPAFLLLGLLAIVGPGLWVAAMNVRYRDFRYIVLFIVQIGLYASPVGFSSALVPEHYRLLYSLNPMVGVIDGFRWALLRGDGGLYLPGLALCIAFSLLALVSGIRVFRRAERTFADVI